MEPSVRNKTILFDLKVLNECHQPHMLICNNFLFSQNPKPAIDIADHHGKTVFQRTCALKDTSFFNKLLENYKNIPKSVMDTSTDDGITPVISACQHGNSEQLKELLEKDVSKITIEKQMTKFSNIFS